MNVFVFIISLSLIFSSLTFLLIARTELKTYIPGYPDIDDKKQLYSLNILADSLLQDIKLKNRYIEGFKHIFEEDIPWKDHNNQEVIANRYDTITNRKSSMDSNLRAEFENQTLHNLYFNETGQLTGSTESSIKSFNFFTPIPGIITDQFH